MNFRIIFDIAEDSNDPGSGRSPGVGRQGSVQCRESERTQKTSILSVVFKIICFSQNYNEIGRKIISILKLWLL